MLAAQAGSVDSDSGQAARGGVAAQALAEQLQLAWAMLASDPMCACAHLHMCACMCVCACRGKRASVPVLPKRQKNPTEPPPEKKKQFLIFFFSLV